MDGCVAFVRLPERVKALRLELSASGDPRFGPLRVREFRPRKLQCGSRFPSCDSGFAQPRVLPPCAQAIRTLWTGGLRSSGHVAAKKGITSATRVIRRVGSAICRHRRCRSCGNPGGNRGTARSATVSILMPVHDAPERFLSPRHREAYVLNSIPIGSFASPTMRSVLHTFARYSRGRRPCDRRSKPCFAASMATSPPPQIARSSCRRAIGGAARP